VGYGHQFDAVYQPTLIVRTVKGMGPEKNCRGFNYGIMTDAPKNPLNLLELLNQG